MNDIYRNIKMQNFHGKIKNGIFTFNNPEYYKFHVGKMKDGNYTVAIKRIQSNRSLQQNRMYWAVLTLISEHTGHTSEELHEIYKNLFLSKKFKLYRGREIELEKHTRTLNKAEFVAYMDNVFTEAGQLGVVVPDVETYWEGRIKND